MIKKLIHFSLHQPLFVALITLLFVGGGVAAWVNQIDPSQPSY